MSVLKLTFADGSVQEFPFASDSTVSVQSTVWEDGAAQVKHGVWAEIVSLEVASDPVVEEPVAAEDVVVNAPVTFGDLAAGAEPVVAEPEPTPEPKTKAKPEPEPEPVEEPVAGKFFGRTHR